MDVSKERVVYSVERSDDDFFEWIVKPLTLGEVLKFAADNNAPIFQKYNNEELSKLMNEGKTTEQEASLACLFHERFVKGSFMFTDKEGAYEKCTQLTIQQEAEYKIGLAEYRQKIIDQQEAESQQRSLIREKKLLIADLQRHNHHDKMHHFC